MDLKWLGLGLPVLAAMLCTTLWQNESRRETMQDMPAVKPTLDDEPRLSSVISKITKDVEDVQCIYYFPSPQTLQNSSLERIWLDQIISKNWCPMKLDNLREEDHIAVLEAYERVQQKPPHQEQEQGVMRQDETLQTAFGPSRYMDISSVFTLSEREAGGKAEGISRNSQQRFLLYLNCFWSAFGVSGFEMLKRMALFIPEDVVLVSARLSNFFPGADTPLGRALSREVRAGRMVETFSKYRATMLFIEDGVIIAMRLNIASMSEECLRKEVVKLWSLPRNASSGFVQSGSALDGPDFFRNSCYV